MNSAFFVLAVIIQFSYCASNSNITSILANISEINLSEDGKLNFTQLATKYGHPAEQYEVATEDGYLLTVFHIPGKGASVLLAHGLAADGDVWVVRGPGSLGIALAEEGYDVWILNNRGTKFSRRHTKLDPDQDKSFWDYSFEDIGCYDVAATIDFVYYQTGEKLFYIGHSQGATQFFALTSLRPEYNEKVELFLALAPGVYFFNMPPLFQIIGDAGPVLLDIARSLGIEELFRDRGALLDLIKIICTKGVLSYAVCVEVVIFPFVGYNPDGFEMEFLPTLVGHAPSGISRKCLEHYDQLYLRKKFSQFDYGLAGNLDKYGVVTPPEYPLSNVTVDVALIAGQLDKVVLVENVQRIREQLPNVVHFEEIESTSHNDFVVGREASKYLFPSIFQLLKKYEKSEDYN